jgi:hypothetical protein
VDDERRAGIIRGILAFCLICGAIAAALFIDLPGMKPGEREEKDSPVEEATPKNIDQIRNQKNCIVVLQAHRKGNEDSERTLNILRELKEERYGDVVKMARFDVEKYPEIAAREGVKPETAPQLSFYANGQRIGEYRGPWQKKPVQLKIDAILHGYMQRIGKEWRPPVPGMKAENNESPVKILPPEKPKQDQ